MSETSAGSSAVDALPPGAVLVHIGPPKTGTTSLQAALFRERPRLAEHGVVYPGRHRRHRREGDALLGRIRQDGKAVPRSAWVKLVEEVRAAPSSRVCISTENLARAYSENVAQAVSDLGADRVHMVVVARRLDLLLPSSWQQRVKGVGEQQSYGDWLHQVLVETESLTSTTFWRHHRLASHLNVWNLNIPRERIIVVIADEADRSGLLRVFERLLDLPAGLLVAQDDPEDPAANTSLTHERVELLRRMTTAVSDRGSSEQRFRLARIVLRALEETPRQDHEHRLPQLPTWAAERVAEASRAQVEAMSAFGVRVVGDPGTLLFDPTGPASMPPDPDVIPIDVAVAALSAIWRPRPVRDVTAAEDAASVDAASVNEQSDDDE